eukprot:5001161-Pyramimonas_sp.AAC.1
MKKTNAWPALLARPFCLVARRRARRKELARVIKKEGEEEGDDYDGEEEESGPARRGGRIRERSRGQPGATR